MARETRYWATFAKPDKYDIEAAVRELEVTTWTVKRSDVRRGGKVLVWRGLSRDRKIGIVAFGEVLSNPAPMNEPPKDRKFWLVDPPGGSARRVWMSLFVPEGLPLWLEDDKMGVLASLSVARSHGGTVFHVTPEQWHQVQGLVGEWHQKEAAAKPFAQEILAPQRFAKGATKTISVNVHERNPAARLACIEHHDLRCCVCGFDFESFYGELGVGFIHVHHIRSLAAVAENYEVDPLTFLSKWLGRITPPFALDLPRIREQPAFQS